MPVSADTLRLHLDYTRWATRRLLDAVTQLSADELTRDFKTSDKNVLETLAHVYAADRIWLSRIRGESRTTFLSPEDKQLSALTQDWPALLERWKEWAAPLTDQDVLVKISYRDLKGNPYQQPL